LEKISDLEEDGKGNDFTRPDLVLKVFKQKFSATLFLFQQQKKEGSIIIHLILKPKKLVWLY
jgi:hypothetical protein